MENQVFSCMYSRKVINSNAVVIMIKMVKQSGEDIIFTMHVKLDIIMAISSISIQYNKQNAI